MRRGTAGGAPAACSPPARRSSQGCSSDARQGKTSMPSMEIHVPERAMGRSGRYGPKGAGNHMHHFAVALDRAVHAEQARTEQLAALALSERRPDHDVDAASLVFEGDEDHPACGVGRCRQVTNPRHLDMASLGLRSQLIGGNELAQSASEKRQGGVAAQRQAEAGVNRRRLSSPSRRRAQSRRRRVPLARRRAARAGRPLRQPTARAGGAPPASAAHLPRPGNAAPLRFRPKSAT